MPSHTVKKTKVKRPKFKHGGEAGVKPKKKRKTLEDLVSEKIGSGKGRTGTTLETPLKSNETAAERKKRIIMEKKKGKRRKTIKP